jgi:hypothetical protein
MTQALWPNDAEVPMIERRDLGLPSRFGDCDDGRIHKSEAEIRIFLLQLLHPQILVRG